MKSRLLVLGLLAAILLMMSGCASEEVKQVRVAALDEAPAEDAFTLTATLCRKVGSKSGRRIGVGSEFTMAKKSYVRAFVDFGNVEPDRPYTVHLVWIRPDGREMFRKYAEVRQQAVKEEEYRTIINWLDAEDLHKVRSDTLVNVGPDFTLESRFNISLSKEREPGLYRFRVYLDRGLLLEKPFTVRERA